MNRLFRNLSCTLALAATALTVHAVEPGFVDLGKFTPAEGREFVEVNLHAPLLKFASALVNTENPEVAELIRGLKHVRVNVVGFDDSNRADTLERVQSIRRELASQGWAPTVTAREAGKASDVAIYVKSGADDSIEGIVVTVIDSGKGEAVFVNLVGNIKPEQIVAIGKGLNIDCLSHLPLKSGGKGA